LPRDWHFSAALWLAKRVRLNALAHPFPVRQTTLPSWPRRKRRPRRASRASAHTAARRRLALGTRLACATPGACTRSAPHACFACVLPPKHASWPSGAPNARVPAATLRSHVQLRRPWRRSRRRHLKKERLAAKACRTVKSEQDVSPTLARGHEACGVRAPRFSRCTVHRTRCAVTHTFAYDPGSTRQPLVAHLCVQATDTAQALQNGVQPAASAL